MKLAIVGGRDFSDYGLLCQKMDKFQKEIGIVRVIVSGGARGADSLAERWAKEHGIPTVIFQAEWEKYGKSAGYKRNKLIVEEADVVLAFWDGASRGTKHSLDLAKEAGKPRYVVKYNNNLDV